MKPDKHKQKRSQQHKKKHESKNDKDNKSQPKKGDNKTQGSDTQSAVRGATYPRQLTKPALHEESSSDDSDEQELKQFHRRRGLVSNWERYEELPEAKSVTSRGADFAILLQGTSSAVAQFRFADEIALDENLEDSLHHQSCLTVDPHELAAAFNCIPLHKKLNIEESLFEKKDLELFKKDADIHKELYEQLRKKKEMKSDPGKPVLGTKNNVVSFLDIDVDLTDVVHNKSTDVLKNSLMKEKPVKTELPSEILDDLDAILLATEPIKVSNVVNSESKCKNGISVLEPVEIKDLSHSLDLMNMCDTTSKPDVVSSLSDKESINEMPKLSNSEDDLNRLLSFDDSSDKTVEEAKSSKTNQETDELEDWLDSVLDA